MKAKLTLIQRVRLWVFLHPRVTAFAQLSVVGGVFVASYMTEVPYAAGLFLCALYVAALLRGLSE